MRYLRLWRRLLTISVMRDIEYRLNTTLGALGTVGDVALQMAIYFTIYRFAGEVAGWSAAEALLLVGVFWIFDGIWGALLGCNLRLLTEQIQEGNLDFILLRPVSAQFLVSCGLVEWWKLSKVAVGVALLALAGERAGVEWTPERISMALAFGASGLALVYALRFAIATLTFWALRVGELYHLPDSLMGGARYPVTYFKSPMREVLTYVVPAAFVTTLPAQALLGAADWTMLPVGAGLAVTALYASHRFWQYALRHYSSAGS
jgi:ABC-2 type transport system permease protein